MWQRVVMMGTKETPDDRDISEQVQKNINGIRSETYVDTW